MFQIQSDLSLLLRKDLDAATSLKNSGVEGSWVTLSSGKAILTTAATKMAWPVITGSHRDGTAGYTYDSVNTGKVAVLCGPMFATTDQFVSTSVVEGSPLKTGAAGKLVIAADGTEAVAWCMKAPYNKTYFGRTISVIDIYMSN